MATRNRTWHSRERRADALALHSAGLGYKKIAARMELSVDTVKSWIHRYGQGHGCLCAEEIITAPISESVEFIPLAEMEEHRVFLVSGPYDFHGKIDAFLAKIPQTLAQNMTVGDVFVFCKRSRYQISALQWQGDGFAMMFKRTEGERYPWPVSTQVKVIEINQEDLRTLLEYPRFVRRLSGLATPESFM
jgi:transposase